MGSFQFHVSIASYDFFYFFFQEIPQKFLTTVITKFSFLFQIQAFQELKDENGYNIVDNFRELQATCGRVVKTSFDDGRNLLHRGNNYTESHLRTQELRRNANIKI